MFPRESAEFIVKHAKNVSFKEEGIQKLSKMILEDIVSHKLTPSNFSQHDLHPKPMDPWALDWIFIVDTLNFCFWTPGIGNSTKYRVNGHTGYFALCAAINRAMKEGIDITNPKYYSSIDVTSLQKLMRSDDGVTKVPLLPERVNCLQQVGQVLLEKYKGTFKNCVLEAENSAQNLLKLITNDFICFRDEALYNGQRVSFYKRAQILVGDVWSCFSGKDIGYFHDIDTITMFADYRVPQVLVHFGAMAYTEALYERLAKEELMPNGSDDEIEIRGTSIYICEQIKNFIRKQIRDNQIQTISENDVNGILIDHFLWDYRRKNAEMLNYIPFHKVLCIYY
ncbi:queuosine salvage protein isoform X1 [Ctenocephalides felis]|uniref:queuosine salvage protein isoform X1 n=1 Tax=Ctenocephalides felis TaxID=7515 RepID=UPI000E6E16C7|nr:queuosine salvage protein isoform X1 [Ctenocephalides felis]